jgi:DNA helicase-2/ATP-dependent DNA helicase PcrA
MEICYFAHIHTTSMKLRGQHDLDAFKNVYNNLNTRQKEAVDAIDGPVLVIAGPGTGKTQILASRIAQILLETDTLPENILCLTYTDAGRIAMRNRLFDFIGSDAYRIAIHTFHSFCNKIIQENSDYFGLMALEPVSELEQIEIIHEMIDEWPAKHPLKRYTGDVYYDTKRLRELYASMKREAWTSDFITQKADAYIQAIHDDSDTYKSFYYQRNGKGYQKGDLKKALFDKELEKMQKLKAAAQSLDLYIQKLQTRGRYDFEDMILWVIRAFNNHPSLLISVQEQYLYFLVDEYQDTSGSQNELLSLLIQYWESPNIFCVGDDDQSIYRFQGANVENIRNFVESYQPKTIALNQNYRSSQNILNAAMSLIELNTESRLIQDKHLTASNLEYATTEIIPEIRCYLNPEHEAAAIASEIEMLSKQGVKLKEIAVLYAKHKLAEPIIAYLEQQRIPYYTRKEVNILEEPLIKQILHILQYIAAEHEKPHSGEHLLYELLHFDCFKMDSIAIARILGTVSNQRKVDRLYSWREALKDKASHSTNDVEKHTHISTVLEGWIKASFNETLPRLIERVINESGILATALTHPDQAWYMQLLHTFFNYVKEESARKPQLSLEIFMETIMLMQKESVELAVNRINYSDDGVQFLTLHSSKGLEFEYVFMIGCDKDSWSKSNQKGFTYPDNLYSIHTKDDTEERRRLFYVGMTRAKKQLVMSFAGNNSKGKEIEKSQYIAELEKTPHVAVSKLHQPTEQLVAFKRKIYTIQTLSASPNLFDNPYVDEMLKNYVMNVTHLNNYLECPTAFYFDKLLRIPAPLSSSMTFGSAIHDALDKFFKKMLQDDHKSFPAIDILLSDFKFYLYNNREAFTEQDYKRKLEYGETILQQYHSHYQPLWNKVVVTEQPYNDIVFEGIPLRGVMDKLEFTGKEVNVVDYKTGNVENASKKLQAPNPEKAANDSVAGKTVSFETQYGGHYWRQAAFYKILMEYAPRNEWTMLSAEFDFVEPEKSTGKFIKEKLHITQHDVTLVGNQIKESYQAIKNKQFEQGCGKPECRWCQFTAYYYKGTDMLMLPDHAVESEDE